ncbi:hypothetical protein PAGU2638_04260 [Lysobacter sp. PAGU 2638]
MHELIDDLGGIAPAQDELVAFGHSVIPHELDHLAAYATLGHALGEMAGCVHLPASLDLRPEWAMLHLLSIGSSYFFIVAKRRAHHLTAGSCSDLLDLRPKKSPPFRQPALVAGWRVISLW